MARAKPEICVAFGAAIRAARLARGMSQELLAFETGLHRTYIGSVERGERNVSILNIQRLCQALGALPSRVLKDSGF